MEDWIGFCLGSTLETAHAAAESNVGRGARDAEVGRVSKHGDESRSELCFHAAYSR